MKIPAVFLRRLQLLNFPVAALLALLQRTPALRVVAAAGDFTLRCPAASVLKSVFAAAASLGAMHSLAGATQLSVSPNENPGTATVGSPKTIFITAKGAPTEPASWIVGGNVPPGMTFSTIGNGTGMTSGLINASSFQLSGTPTAAGSFRVSLQVWEFLDAKGDSVTFSYTVNVAAAANTPPSFTAQPSSQSAQVGGAAVFFVSAVGSPSLSYQWRKNGALISNQTDSSLTLSNLTTNDSGSYTCVVTNAFGTATSNAALLTVTDPNASPPVFSVQPVSKTVSNNSTVVFSASATGSPAPAYQWQKNGATIGGATSPTLVIPGATAANAGDYTCVATNSSGPTLSNTATLAISTTSDFGRIINLSILTNLSAGEGLFTVGTVIGGAGTSGNKPILLRAAGPSLAQFGVAGVLPDPKLDQFSGTTNIASNDNWGGTEALKNAFSAVGAFGYISDTSNDAALLSPALVIGSYTVQIRDVAGASGTVIAELYDETPAANFTATTPRLINVSVRKQVASGEILTAGFVIGGTTAKTVLIRAIGPTLAGFGVGGTMADPKLDLFSNQTVIASNDNWGGDASLTTAGNSVGAFAIPSATSKDAILLITLAPGSYTVQATGVSGSSGQVLVEVYEVP